MKKYDLIVVIPVYNECEIIKTVLVKWSLMLDQLKIRYVIRAYDDGSKDKSGEILDCFAKENPDHIQVIHQTNAGHGPTILHGYRDAANEADWIFQVDSDDEMRPDSFPSLWEKREEYDFLVGRRSGRKQPFLRSVISAISRISVRLFYGKGIQDVNTPYRLMRASSFSPLYASVPENTFAPNVILTGLAARNHLRSLEISVEQHNRKTGEVSLKKWKLLKASVRSFLQTLRMGKLTSQGFWLFFIVLSVICLTLSFATLTRSPLVHIDEVSYNDPGIRLAGGEGFTSSVWYSQNEETFFAGNVPLHPFLISGWVSVCGESVFSIRSFNILLLFIATLLVIPLCKKLRIASGPALLLILSLWCFPGISFSCRSGRPDMELLVLGILALLSFFSKKRKYGCLGLLGAMAVVPFAGLQGCVWIPLLLALAFTIKLYLDGGEEPGGKIRDAVPKAICAIIGLAIGFAALHFLYRINGASDIFWDATLGKHAFKNGKRIAVVNLGMTCFSLIPFVTVTFLNCCSLACRKKKMWFLFSLLVTISIPLLIATLGVYPHYYFYMGDFSAMLLLAVGMTHAENARKYVMSFSCSAVLVLCMMGMPSRSALSLLSWKERDYEPVCQFFTKHIPTNSVVSMSWETYYALRKVTHRIYMFNTPIAKRPVPSIYEKNTEYWVVNGPDVPNFTAKHPQLEKVATFPPKSEQGVQRGSYYPFAIFRNPSK